MQAYLSKGKELLKLLLNNGYEAYFVGEVVRNTLVGIKYKRVDIITNADFETLRRIFKSPIIHVFDGDIEHISDNTLKLTYFEYEFYFHPFVSNQNNTISENRTAFSKHYSKNLLDDLATKNFTINAIAMSYSGKLTDTDDGIEDIKNKKIRTVGSPKQKFNSSPIEILNALVLASELRFKISDKTYSMMKKKAKLIQKAELDNVISCLEDILNFDNAKHAIRLLVSAKIHKYIPSLTKGLARLAYRFKKISFEELLLMSFVLNKEIDPKYYEYIENIDTFKKIFHLALSNPKAKYDELIMFNNGIDVCLEANFINYMVGKCGLKSKAIKKAFSALKISGLSDLKIDANEIMRITNVRDSDIINAILKEACMLVLEDKLNNDYNSLQSFVLRSLTEKGILYDLDKNRKEVIGEETELDEEEVLKKTFNTDYDANFHETNYQDPSRFFNEDESIISNQLANQYEEIEPDDYTSHRLRILEERLDEQERSLKEKEERIKEMEYKQVLEASSKIIDNTIKLIKNDNQVSSMIKNPNDFELELRAFVLEYLERDKSYDEEN